MSGFTQPSIKQVDTTNPKKDSSVSGANSFATDVLNNPNRWIQQFASYGPDLTGLKASADANPEGDAFAKLAPLLLALAGQGNQFKELGFSEKFNELKNPYGDIGAMNPAFGTIAAQMPIFDRNFQKANTQLSASAPGRFSSAYAGEGIDLGARSLQDFNLFANQALQQGQQLQLQQQQAGLNYALGARGLQQEEVANVRGSNLNARGLQQQAQQNADSNSLNAFGQYGNLAGQAGMNQYNRQLGAAGVGLQAQQNAINPVIQMLMAAMNYGNPESMTPVVGPSGAQTLTGGLSTLANIFSLFGNPFGGGNSQPGYWNPTQGTNGGPTVRYPPSGAR